MPEAHRQLAIEDHVLLVCPHCWTMEQLAEDYPELANYPVSQRICNFISIFRSGSQLYLFGERASGFTPGETPIA